MALDIFGPASAPGAVTVRPGEIRSFTATDSFFKDCSNPSIDDGTEIQAAWLNQMLAVLRSLTRTNGQTAGAVDVVTEDNSDDNLLRKAVQHIIQRGQTLYSADSGTADAMVAALSPAPAEYKTGTVWWVKKAAAANATATPTINFNVLGAKTIVKRDGGALAAGDLPAGVLLGLYYDGTNMRVISFVASDVAAQKSPFNVQQVSFTARTSYSGIVGMQTYQTGSYTKKSATSTLVVRMSTNVYSLTNAAGLLKADLGGGNTMLAVIANSDASLAKPAGNAEKVFTGLSAGSISWSLQFGRNDAVAWASVVNPRNTDVSYLPTETTTAISFYELEP